MRTTLDIDDDILLAARERAALEGRSLGAVLSALAREALRGATAQGARAASGRQRAGGRFAVMPRRDEIVTLERVRQLQEEEGV